ncbi:MAG TPA: hypothetical protein VGP99_09230 [Tepidisphaeraceae bacterium]|nr:hypothetical protein [Tepidisphaeraceae bacterium]
MDFLAALGIDGVRDISVKFQAAMAISVLIAHEAVFVEAIAAIGAITGAEVIFLTATSAMIAQFTRGHGEKQTVVAIDQLYVANHECMIKGEGAKGLQTTGLSIAQFYAHFREQHKNPCCENSEVNSDLWPRFLDRYTIQSCRNDFLSKLSGDSFHCEMQPCNIGSPTDLTHYFKDGAAAVLLLPHAFFIR